MRGYCRKCREEWAGPEGFIAHLHPVEVRHPCVVCGAPTYADDEMCGHCQRIHHTATQAVAS